MTKPIKYKQTGLEWCPQIPEHWELKKLKYLISINDEVLLENTDEEYEILYIEIGDVSSDKGISNKTLYKFGDAPSRARRIVQNGDIIVSTVRTYLKAISKIDNPEDNLIVSTGFAVLRPLDLDSRFLGYYCLSSLFIEKVISESRGVSYPAINAQDVGNISILKPAVEKEQQKIADYLDRKTSLIDSIISKKEKQIELYKEERTAIINHAVTKGLNPDVEMKDSGIEWLGSIPKHWEVCSLKQQIIVKDGTHDTPEYLEQSKNTFPFVTSKDIVDSSICFDSVKYISKEDYLVINSRSDVQFNDVIMPMIGTVGGCAIVDTHIPFSIKNVALFKTSFGNLVPQYLSYVLDSFIIKTQFEICARGGVQRFVSLEILKNLKIFKVSKKEQQEIATYLDNETNRIDTLVYKTSKQIELLKEYKEALINEVVTGQRIIH